MLMLLQLLLLHLAVGHTCSIGTGAQALGAYTRYALPRTSLLCQAFNHTQSGENCSCDTPVDSNVR